MLDEFDLELLDKESKLVLVEELLDVFALVLPACALAVASNRIEAAPVYDTSSQKPRYPTLQIT